MNPLFEKQTSDEQEPIILPQDDNPQGDKLEPNATEELPEQNIPTRHVDPSQPQPHQTEYPKLSTGEMSADDVTREEYPIYFAIADALGGTVEPFDVYQGPYIQVPGEGRLFINSEDGASAQIWNESTHAVSDAFMGEDENAAVDAAISVLENPPANTLPYGEERENYEPDTESVPNAVGEEWVPEMSEADKIRLRGIAPIKGAKNPLLKKAIPLTTGQYGQSTCYKCKQPIQQGQTVSWEGGVEVHAGGCPPPQGTAQEESRIMFPRGQKPKQPQMNTQQQKTPQRAPIKPMYSSAVRVATRRTVTAGYVPATSWGVPQENAHEVARTLAECGMQDFDVATDESVHVAYFSFGSEAEMEACADIVCELFGPQIAASKGRWKGWQCRPDRAPSVPVAGEPITKLNSKSAELSKRKRGGNKMLDFPTFKKWWGQVKNTVDPKRFTVDKVPGFGVSNGAVRLSYDGNVLGYLGFPLEAFEGLVGPIRNWLEKSQNNDPEYDPYQMERLSSEDSQYQDIDNPLCLCSHEFNQHESGKDCDHCDCIGFDPAPMRKQVEHMCEMRSFSRVGKKDNPMTFERHDGESVLKVFFDGDDRIKEATFNGESRAGWEGFFSWTQAYGD